MCVCVFLPYPFLKKVFTEVLGSDIALVRFLEVAESGSVQHGEPQALLTVASTFVLPTSWHEHPVYQCMFSVLSMTLVRRTKEESLKEN